MHRYCLVTPKALQHCQVLTPFHQKVVGDDFQPVQVLPGGQKICVMLGAKPQAEAGAGLRDHALTSPITPLPFRQSTAVLALKPWPLHACSTVLQSLLPLQSCTL